LYDSITTCDSLNISVSGWNPQLGATLNVDGHSFTTSSVADVQVPLFSNQTEVKINVTFGTAVYSLDLLVYQGLKAFSAAIAHHSIFHTDYDSTCPF
jgi:hypothetical protein